MESVSESKFKGSSGRYRPCTGARTFSSSSDERITTEFYINSSIKRKNRQKQPVQSHRRGRLRYSKFHLSPVPDPIWVNLCEKWGESDIFVKFFKSEKFLTKILWRLPRTLARRARWRLVVIGAENDAGVVGRRGLDLRRVFRQTRRPGLIVVGIV